MNLPLLKSLSEAPGVPGREERVRAILQREAHTVTECIHKRDLQAAIDVLAAWLETPPGTSS